MRKISELKRRNNAYRPMVLGMIALTALAIFIYNQVPQVHQQIDWEIDKATTYLRLSLDPVQPMPTPIMSGGAAAGQPAQSPVGSHCNPHPYSHPGASYPHPTVISPTISPDPHHYPNPYRAAGQSSPPAAGI